MDQQISESVTTQNLSAQQIFEVRFRIKLRHEWCWERRYNQYLLKRDGDGCASLLLLKNPGSMEWSWHWVRLMRDGLKALPEPTQGNQITSSNNLTTFIERWCTISIWIQRRRRRRSNWYSYQYFFWSLSFYLVTYLRGVLGRKTTPYPCFDHEKATTVTGVMPPTNAIIIVVCSNCAAQPCTFRWLSEVCKW